MKPTLSRELALDALMMAVWRRKPDGEVIVHSDQGSQYGSDDWQRFCRANHLAPSMSRRGNCWDNAVAESFFSSLKKERIRKRIYKTRGLARADIFDYIEVFYNRARTDATSAASVRRPLNRPRREDRICLQAWGQSNHHERTSTNAQSSSSYYPAAATGRGYHRHGVCRRSGHSYETSLPAGTATINPDSAAECPSGRKWNQ